MLRLLRHHLGAVRVMWQGHVLACQCKRITADGSRRAVSCGPPSALPKQVYALSRALCRLLPLCYSFWHWPLCSGWTQGCRQPKKGKSERASRNVQERIRNVKERNSKCCLRTSGEMSKRVRDGELWGRGLCGTYKKLYAFAQFSGRVARSV